MSRGFHTQGLKSRKLPKGEPPKTEEAASELFGSGPQEKILRTVARGTVVRAGGALPVTLALFLFSKNILFVRPEGEKG